MWKLYNYEWKKLVKQRAFLGFVLVLLLGNLLFLFQYERQKDVYEYCYLHKTEWQKFCKDDKDVVQAEVYTALKEREEQYVASYKEFLEQIPQQAEILKKTTNYQNTDTFLYHNLEKTVTDYASLGEIELKADPSIAVKELATYDYGIYFQFIFLFVLSYFMISAERKQGLFLLSKGTKQGHLPLVVAKLGTMLSASVVFCLLQEIGSIFFMGHFYGYGDLGRNIQSVSIFRDCTLSISVLQALAGMVVIRITISIFCTLLIACLTIVFRKEGIARMFYVAIIVAQWYLNQVIELSGSLQGMKCINVFFVWNMKNVFGIYQNLNIGGYPVGKNVIAGIVMILLSVLFICIALYRFSLGCQMSSGSLFEEIRERIARRTSFIWHHTSVYFFEFRKVFFQQKKGILFVLLLVWCVCSVKNAGRTCYYADPAINEYHRILAEISGPVTEESLFYIDEQRAEIDDMYKELDSLKNATDQNAELKKNALMHEIQLRADGVTLVEEQRDSLLEKDGSVYDKYWVDEKKYIELFYDYQYELLAFFIAMVALVIWMSNLEAADEQKGLHKILYTTKGGKTRIQKEKVLVGFSGLFWFTICQLLPQIVRYAKVEQFQGIRQQLCNFTSVEYVSTVTVGGLLLATLLGKILVCFAVGILLLLLVRKVSNTAIVIGIGVGILGLFSLLFAFLRLDVTILILQTLS